jgi:6,7-dimethyl-8-ribityllumazine synthase
MALLDLPIFGPMHVDPAWKIGVVRSTWHDELTSVMASSCIAKLKELGIPEANIFEITAPGSFEVPLFCGHALQQLGCDGVIAFGIVLQGATHHADLVAREAARGCMKVQLDTGKPVTFEVLYVNTLDDARRRSVGKEAKGPLAAQTVLSCLAKQAELRR